MKSRVIKASLLSLAALAVLIQFVPVDRSNPPITREIAWDSEATEELARRSCYDCHSNETEWPWYSSVAPVSWLVARDVAEARGHLNFSTWDRSSHDPDEIPRMVEDGEMPPGRYTLAHPGARLDEVIRAALAQGLRATLAVDPPAVAEGEGDDHEHE